MLSHHVHTGGGIRQPISGLSQASASKLRRVLASIDLDGRVVDLISLSYHRPPMSSGVLDLSVPSASPQSIYERQSSFVIASCVIPAKKHLSSWLKRFERSFAREYKALLWKMEFQRRGIPHFHILIVWKGMDAPQVDLFRAWVSSSWTSIVAPSDQLHLRFGADVWRLLSPSGLDRTRLLRYIAKRIGTTPGRVVDPSTGEIVSTGRIWGVRGDLPTKVLSVVELSSDDHVDLCRRLRRWGRVSPYLSRLTSKWAGFLVQGDGSRISQLLQGLGDATDGPDAEVPP